MILVRRVALIAGGVLLGVFAALFINAQWLQPDVHYAERIYARNAQIFEYISEFFPGAYSDIRHIHDDEYVWAPPLTDDERHFFKRIRAAILVDFISFFPNNRERGYEIKIELHGLGWEPRHWGAGVAYFSAPHGQMAYADLDRSVAIFAKCSQEAKAWFRKNRRTGMAIMYCGIGENWYAYQYVSNDV